MSENNHIKSFTAADIEKYHKGQLSPKEMHELEKASLDDPFLADALEGYATPNVNIAGDMTDLNQRLANRISEKEETKLIPISSRRSTTFYLWRIAAMVVLIAGAGFLIYRLAFHEGFDQKNSEIAKTPAPDSNKINPSNPPAATNSIVADSINSNLASIGRLDGNSFRGLTDSSTALSQNRGESSKSGDVATNNLDLKTSQPKTEIEKAVAPSVTQKKQAEKDDMNAKEFADKEIKAMQERERDQRALLIPESDSVLITSSGNYKYSTAQNQKSRASRNYANPGILNSDNSSTRMNLFRGKVTDANNNALPFANITNLSDNVGTYSDANGNFTLISPDSVLNVQVRSVGFENNNIQLQNQNVPVNQVVMQEDRSSLAEVVVSNKHVNSAARSRTSTMVLDEPEPIDGWVNYDTYLANNLIVPETFKTKQSTGGEVQLTFEVNSQGEPINIKVVKSLCESCDQEAIRLVKEGPKWKRKSRKGKTSVTIRF